MAARWGVKKALRRAAVVPAVLLVSALAWGLAEPRLVVDVERHDAAIPGLPAAWEGERVGLLADFRVGMWLDNVGAARRMVERLVDERPELALLAGDFVYGGDETPEHVATVVDVVRPLPEAGVPTHAVLGNHDFSAGAASALRNALEDVGVEVLTNEAVALPSPGGETPGGGRPLHLVGVGAHRPGRDRPEAAVDQVPDGASRLVLMHNPASFPPLPAGTAPLAVAGHTHGGQVRVPFTPGWSWLTVVRGQEAVDGWIEDYGEAGNRGVGMSLVPIRINCPPELTLFTLRGAPVRGAAS